MFYRRNSQSDTILWLRPLHYIIGSIMVILVLLLLVIGTIKSRAYLGGIAAPAMIPTTVEPTHVGTIGEATPKKYATRCGTESTCSASYFEMLAT